MKKKILIIIKSLHLGGTEKQLLNILKEINKTFEFKIFLLDYDGILIKDFERLSIEVIGLKRSSGIKKKNFLIYFINIFLLLIKLIKSFNPKIIHFYLPHSYLICGWLSFVFRKKIFLMSRRSMNYYQKKYFFSKKIEFFLHKKMNFIIANSNAVKRQLLQEEGVNDQKCEVIFNGVNIQRIKKNFKDKKVITFLCIANFLPYKNHLILLNALSMIPSSIKWKLDLVGKQNKYSSYLKDISNKLKLKNKIYFHDSTPNVKKFLKNSDIGILVSDEEGFSNTILEYMSFGLPVLATNVGGIPEAIKNGVNGFLIQKNNQKQLTENIIKLSTNVKLRKKISNSNLKKVEQCFNISSACKNYTRFYLNLLNQR